MTTLSKSRFISGTQCEKKLYFDVFRQDLKPLLSNSVLYTAGHEIVLPTGKVFN